MRRGASGIRHGLLARYRRAGLLLQTTVGQILGIVFVTLGVTSGLIAVLLISLPPYALPPLPWPWPQAATVARIVNALRNADTGQQDAYVARAEQDELVLDLVEASAPCGASTPAARSMEHALRALIDEASAQLVFEACEDEDGLEVRIPLDARMLTVRIPLQPLAMSPAVTMPMLTFIFCLSISSMMLAAWAVRRVVRPLERLSEGVRQFGSAMAIAPLQEQGPTEVRRAAQAFNQMQQEILRLLQERSLALAAIGHDLRTPLTRMRLRLELELDAQSPFKDRMVRDMDTMQSMLSTSFAYLKGEAEREPHERLDLTALTLAICDDFREAGYAIICDAAQPAFALGHRESLVRAIANLLENAFRYGTIVQVNVLGTATSTIVHVLDDGPGIPLDRRQDMLKPFRQLDGKASGGGQGGLGLSIVQSIVQAHRGELRLLDSHLGGLMVSILLPASTDGGVH
ncbi:ATP-binding protein [Roseomonas sp. F4]